jgi:SAM-dependent methyltransferase
MAGQREQRHEPGGSDPAGRSDVELLGDLDRAGAWMLLVDGVPQSHVDLDDPTHLELEYVRRIGHLIDLAGPAGSPLRVLHLGGGGLTLARYVAATRPGSSQLAVEADPEVARVVREGLPLDQPGRSRTRTGRIVVRLGDARAELAQLLASTFDLVVADVFAGGQTPAHLTSAEFAAAVARVLAPSGVLAVNVADGSPLTHVRGRLAAVRSALPQACLIAEAGVLRGRRFGNLVIAASATALPVAGLTRRLAADPFPARLIEGAELSRFLAGARPISDADAEPSPLPPPGAFT